MQHVQQRNQTSGVWACHRRIATLMYCLLLMLQLVYCGVVRRCQTTDLWQQPSCFRHTGARVTQACDSKQACCCERAGVLGRTLQA
jgi:hypothetical protein